MLQRFNPEGLGERFKFKEFKIPQKLTEAEIPWKELEEANCEIISLPTVDVENHLQYDPNIQWLAGVEQQLLDFVTTRVFSFRRQVNEAVVNRLAIKCSWSLKTKEDFFTGAEYWQEFGPIPNLRKKKQGSVCLTARVSLQNPSVPISYGYFYGSYDDKAASVISPRSDGFFINTQYVDLILGGVLIRFIPGTVTSPQTAREYLFPNMVKTLPDYYGFDTHKAVSGKAADRENHTIRLIDCSSIILPKLNGVPLYAWVETGNISKTFKNEQVIPKKVPANLIPVFT